MKSSRSKRGPRCKPLVYKTQEQNLADQLQACLHSLEETQLSFSRSTSVPTN